MFLKIYTYKKDNLKSPIQISTNRACNYSKNLTRRLLECYWFSTA